MRAINRGVVALAALTLLGLAFAAVSDAQNNIGNGGSGSPGGGGSSQYTPVSVKSFGATGNGSTDDTAAIQRAFTWATASTAGRRLLCNDGTYLLSSSITIANVQGLAFIGQGSCIFTWAGNNSTPMFDLQDVAYSRFEGFQIQGNASHQLLVGMRLSNGAGSSVTPTMNHFVNIWIYGVNGYITNGFHIASGGAGGDNNNDFHLFENVHVNNYLGIAFALEATQAHFTHFLNDYCISGHVGVACVSGIDVNHSAGASFIWDGGFSGQNSDADFLLKCNVAGQPYVIRNLSSEGSDRFIDWNGVCGSVSPLTVEDVRWSDTALDADGIAIFFRGAGPVTIKDSKIGDQYSHAIKIQWDYVGGFAPPNFVLLNTNILGTLTTLGTIFNSHLPTYVIGSSAMSSDTVNTKLDIVPATSSTTATNIAGGLLGTIPYQSAVDTTALLAGNTVANDKVLVSHGTGTVSAAPTLSNAPTLSATNMTSFPTLNQNTTGTGNIAGGLLGSIPYQSAVNATTVVAGNTAATDQVLVSHGTGSVSAIPTFSNAPALSAANMTSFPTITALTYGAAATSANCLSIASPAVCAAAPAGSVTIAAAATTKVVNTTAVTANSEILILFDSSLGTRLSVTCNTTLAAPTVSARTAGTSFTISTAVAPTTNPACYSYSIVN